MCSQSLGTCACEGGTDPCSCGCSDASETNSKRAGSWLIQYVPLLGVLTGITLLTVALALAGSMDIERGMSLFMAFFFLVFGGLQLINIKEYVPNLARYNLLVKKIPAWGYILPPLEIILAAVFFYDAFGSRVTSHPELMSMQGITMVMNMSSEAPSALHASPILLIACIITLFITTIDAIGVVHSLVNGRRPTCACLGVILAVPLSPLTVAEDLVMLGMATYMIYLVR